MFHKDPSEIVDSPYRLVQELVRIIKRRDTSKRINLLVLDIETVPLSKNLPQDRIGELWKNWIKRQIDAVDDENAYQEAFVERAGFYPEFGKIVAVGLGVFDFGGESEDDACRFKVLVVGSDSEKALLRFFKKVLEGTSENENGERTRFLRSLDVHKEVNSKYPVEGFYFVGHNIREFDLPYLARRMIINGIELPEHLKIAGLTQWNIRHVIDTMELWAFGGRRGRFVSLDLLTTVLGLSSPKAAGITGEDMYKLYYEERDYKTILEYCRRDVQSTAEVFLKLGDPEGACSLQLMEIEKDIIKMYGVDPDQQYSDLKKGLLWIKDCS